ncbi:hypothetical protein [Megamonas hypermegale]|uniref:hypothetical protein n=1 Tax=Megamonas hypermegale TaxID=158847 RepID=UPI0026EACC26|nr:hypothetical protein [Megamonas hypermegale]
MNATIKLRYSGVIYSKKNSKRIITNRKTGKPTIISSKNAKDMETDMVSQFIVQARRQGWKSRTEARDKSIYDVTICITEKDHTRRDLDNQATSILDALVAAKVLPDDSVKFVRSLYVVYMGVNKDDPHADIQIEQNQEE